jgi:hypothetical protein
MDIREMSFENEKFDVVIDKGLLDTVLVLLIMTVRKLFHPKFRKNVI